MKLYLTAAVLAALLLPSLSSALTVKEFDEGRHIASDYTAGFLDQVITSNYTWFETTISASGTLITIQKHDPAGEKANRRALDRYARCFYQPQFCNL